MSLTPLTVAVDTTRGEDGGVLAMPLDSDRLLAVIRRTYAGREEFIPDSVEVSEPIREIGLYNLFMIKDGERFQRLVWVVRSSIWKN